MSFYAILLALHNLNRWLVLLTGVWAVIQSISGLNGKRPFTPAERRPVSMFMGTLHLQVVLGLLLFAYMGMQKIPVFAGAGRSSFQWEHLGLGVLAAVFGTLASTQSRKAGSEVGKYRAAALWSGLALLMILGAMPWFRPLLPHF
ncbi:hypothetical protein D3875_09015 [Deinococcus cavernae]|uniref:Cytochrome B n=1 Tax=Deinococcus cavernae TaxID=2320857 RepID=A0A418V6I8_9DEIO|nr:hypothetical protein [Deinococcus cavernae]RJF71689.1 hypothetical protein D3875_09015 [Deinococcus cavernae]